MSVYGPSPFGDLSLDRFPGLLRTGRRVAVPLRRSGPALGLIGLAVVVLGAIYWLDSRSPEPRVPGEPAQRAALEGRVGPDGARSGSGAVAPETDGGDRVRIGMSSADPVPLDDLAPRFPPRSSGGLVLPLPGLERSDLRDSYDDPRSGGRRHEAIDIMAPRGTPVVSVADGTVARLFSSRLGGRTIYISGMDGDRIYYYAHLDAYVSGLEEGDRVLAGQRIGFVGTSGNAPADAPHLHFAIHELEEGGGWWQGTPVNPYPLLLGDDT